MNLTAFFGISDCFASIWFLSQSPKLIMVIMSWFKVHLGTCFTTQNALNFGGWKVPVTFFHGNGLLKTAPDPWRNNPQITLSHNSSKCWKMNSPEAHESFFVPESSLSAPSRHPAFQKAHFLRNFQDSVWRVWLPDPEPGGRPRRVSWLCRRRSSVDWHWSHSSAGAGCSHRHLRVGAGEGMWSGNHFDHFDQVGLSCQVGIISM